MTPSRPPTRRELIEDAAYVEWAAQGNAPLDERGAHLVAIWRLLGLIAAAQGVDMREEARLAADPEALRPRPPSADAPRDAGRSARRRIDRVARKTQKPLLRRRQSVRRAHGDRSMVHSRGAQPRRPTLDQIVKR